MKPAGPKVLHLTLKKQWFDMIASGEKVEEYREVKSYWINRFSGKKYDVVQFRNGYRPDSPSVSFQLLGIRTDFGRPSWGAPESTRVFILDLGEKLNLNPR
ncbi:MAG: ASCH domain-containing protein [Candidatus Electrothrix aestuarii]|uniref:ASCH domain-containing protein n=1 Tax=Candidatus Electrothrix aestuarii TaxID=3062594 RepID=A0AAU8LS75_9BACT|nr:hypothetical protein [Candidatus Electrothrix aestuarii]